MRLSRWARRTSSTHACAFVHAAPDTERERVCRRRRPRRRIGCVAHSFRACVCANTRGQFYIYLFSLFSISSLTIFTSSLLTLSELDTFFFSLLVGAKPGTRGADEGFLARGVGRLDSACFCPTPSPTHTRIFYGSVIRVVFAYRTHRLHILYAHHRRVYICENLLTGIFGFMAKLYYALFFFCAQAGCV